MEEARQDKDQIEDAVSIVMRGCICRLQTTEVAAQETSVITVLKEANILGTVVFCLNAMLVE